MKLLFLRFLFLSAIPTLVSWVPSESKILGTGMQPQASIDGKGIIRMVYGSHDSIFCATSANQGVSFSTPVFVSKIAGMHLGMSRGPKIASSMNVSIITAMDKSGDIHFFRLDHYNGTWMQKGQINDMKSSAPEGLMSIAADKKDNFYAVWLDTRKDKKNNIYFSSLSASQNSWSTNKLVYQSPDNHVCECCKPNIAVSNNIIALMFRNWIDGSRDLYLVKSNNKGQSFGTAQKLGAGTWKLNGCPMDGGAIVFDNKNNIQTTWQRQGVIYTCRPGEPEVKLATGRSSNMTADEKSENLFVSLQEGENIKIIDTKNKADLITLKGRAMEPLTLRNGKVLCIWESDKSILFRLL